MRRAELPQEGPRDDFVPSHSARHRAGGDAARAAEEGARRALSEFGLKHEDTTLDVQDLRCLLDVIRLARRTVLETTLRLITTGVLIALLAGVAVKLRVFSNGP